MQSSDKFGRDAQIERVNRERRLIGHEHPNLIQIYDAGVCNRTGFLFVAMELHNAVNLTEVIPNFPSERIYPVIAQIASAAKYLENRELVHRDIKPDNIVIAEDYSNATLLDLGVLRPVSNLDDDVTTATAFLGTTRYSSPEYLLREGEEESMNGWRALTFYQLGGLLHDMIMRRRLFDAIDAPPPRLTDAVRYENPVIESAEVQPRLVGLAKSCLQKDWKLRLKLVSWESFSEVSTELGREATEARIAERISTKGRSGQPQERNRTRGSQRLALQRVRSRVSRLLAHECTDAGLFPPLRIDGADSFEKNTTRVVLRTGPSTAHAISQRLTIRFAAEVLDFGSMHVQILGLAALGAVDVEPGGQGTAKVFVGELGAPELSELLRKFAVMALDAAQQQVVFGNSSVLVVKWEGR